MKTVALLVALAMALPAAVQAQQQRSPVVSSQGQMGDVPPPGFRGQWFTTSDGCTYSRTQAPGYPVQWMIVLNPRHIGQPDAHSRCKTML